MSSVIMKILWYFYSHYNTFNYELEDQTKSGEVLLINGITGRDPKKNFFLMAQDVIESNKNNLAVIAIANEVRQLV